jgi:hypothetical protein
MANEELSIKSTYFRYLALRTACINELESSNGKITTKLGLFNENVWKIIIILMKKE